MIGLLNTVLRPSFLTASRRAFSSKLPSLNDVKSEKEALEFINATVESNPLVVFMKGTADRPQCGFSRTVIQVLQQFPNLPRPATVDVLSNEQVRSAIKTFSNWPTVPQLYTKGEFVGGCDIVYEMYKSGTLLKHFQDSGLLSKEEEESKEN